MGFVSSSEKNKGNRILNQKNENYIPQDRVRSRGQLHGGIVVLNIWKNFPIL